MRHPLCVKQSEIWKAYCQNTTVFIIARGGTLAINNYMFRPLNWPSSGCTPCYKVTIFTYLLHGADPFLRS